MDILHGRPLRKTGVATAIHCDPAVTPRLLADPINHVVDVSAVVFIRHVVIQVRANAATVGHDADIAFADGLLSKDSIVGTLISCIEQDRGKWVRLSFLVNDYRGN